MSEAGVTHAWVAYYCVGVVGKHKAIRLYLRQCDAVLGIIVNTLVPVLNNLQLLWCILLVIVVGLNHIFDHTSSSTVSLAHGQHLKLVW